MRLLPRYTRTYPPLPFTTLFLSGKALFDFLVWADGDDLLIDCEAEAADDLVKRLTLYRLRRKLGIARDDALAVHWQASEYPGAVPEPRRSEEHTSEIQSLMRISYAVFGLKKQRQQAKKNNL